MGNWPHERFRVGSKVRCIQPEYPCVAGKEYTILRAEDASYDEYLCFELATQQGGVWVDYRNFEPTQITTEGWDIP